MQDQEKGRLLTAAEVAEIWNERAREDGYDTHYTRFSVRQRHRKAKKGGEFTPALETPIGFLYWEKDAKEFPLQPQKSKKRGKDQGTDEPDRSSSVTPHHVQAVSSAVAAA